MDSVGTHDVFNWTKNKYLQNHYRQVLLLLIICDWIKYCLVFSVKLFNALVRTAVENTSKIQKQESLYL